MNLPVELDELLQRANTSLLRSPEGDLRPLLRKEVYMALGPVETRAGRWRRTCLAVAATRHVMPVWLTERPLDTWPERLLSLAKSLLEGRVDERVAQDEITRAWYWSTNENSDRQEEIPYTALSVLDAARGSLEIASGFDRLDAVDLREDTIDFDLDAYTRDPSVYASMAIARPTWVKECDNEARFRFWSWWLTDAVPSAWAAEFHPNMQA